MASEDLFKLGIMNEFYEKNKDFDLLRFDFHNKAAVSSLKLDGLDKNETVERLKACQRLLRVYADNKVAERLLERGLDSAHKIASMPEHMFIRENRDIFDDDEEKAAEAYRKAVHIITAVSHLYGAVKDMVASPHYTASTFCNTHASVVEYHKNIPAYQDLFGSLDYLEYDEFQSILSPAAYFTDIMRIVDQYITDPNINPVRRIPLGYKLEERRPDLFNLKLTGVNTTTVVPYLEIVNNVLKENIEYRLGKVNAYQALAAAPYPFNLPFSLPLSRLKLQLAKLGTSLAGLYESFRAVKEKEDTVNFTDICREITGLSVTEMHWLTKPDASQGSLNKYYGYNIAGSYPDFKGSGIIGLAAGQAGVSGLGTEFLGEIEVGDTITVGEMSKKVAAINSDTELTVDGNWANSAGKEYKVVPCAPLRKPPYEGIGKIFYYNDATIKAIKDGTTDFKKDFIKGDEIIIYENSNRIVLHVDKVISKSEMKVREALRKTFPIDKYVVKQIVPREPEPSYDGPGVILYASGNANVYGQSTMFLDNFKKGDSIEVDGVRKKVINIASNVKMTVDSSWSKTEGSGFLIIPSSVSGGRGIQLPVTGKGSINIENKSITVLGNNTQFKSELNVGDQISVASSVRTVIGIDGNDKLFVDAPWSMTKSDESFTILKQIGIDAADVFLKRTGLTQDKLRALFVQKLSESELKTKGAEKLFINDTGEGLPPLVAYLTDDPENLVQRIQGLSLQRLDRLNRFIRLAGTLGWEFWELDWAMKASRQKEITGDLIISLAQIKKLKDSTGLSIEQLTAFRYGMKTIGREDDRDPQDLFDRVFNNPALLHGQDPYKSSEVPFNPFRMPVQTWKIEDITGINGTIRGRLKAALMLNDNDLSIVSGFALSLTGKNCSDSLELDLANLTWLYRISKMSEYLELTPDEYLNLLYLLFYPKEEDYMNPPRDSIPETWEGVSGIIDAAWWLKKSSFTIYQLKYILKGSGAPDYDPGYKQADIASFINSRAAMAEDSHLKPVSLKIGGLDEEQAAQAFIMLAGNHVVNDAGLFTKYSFVYEDAAKLLPVNKNNGSWTFGFNGLSFRNATGDDSESVKVFDALKAHKLLIEAGCAVMHVILDNAFNQSTDLSFLKEVLSGDDKDFKIQQVRGILLSTRSHIYLLLEVLEKTQSKQRSNVIKGLSDFLVASEETVGALLPFASIRSGLKDYLAGFLTPIPSGKDIPAEINGFIRAVSQWKLLAEGLGLNGAQTLYITSGTGPSHFNIGDINNISINNIISIAEYKKLVNDWNDTNDSLLDYFRIPDGNLIDARIKILAGLTGWNETQIYQLIEYFWYKGTSAELNYDTVAGLKKLKGCFDMAGLLGASIGTLLGFCRLSHLSVLGENGELLQEHWKEYENAADNGMNLLNAKYNGIALAGMMKDIAETVNTLSRDALLGYALWLISSVNRLIKSPSDLCQYLLIDTEMGGCAATSLIAQAIASVQLYMQRCRMKQEMGVTDIKVPEIWWTWISNYRIWEVNRKIFLYPENYIEPSLRKNSTPEFSELSDSLLQNSSKDNVQKSFENYFHKLSILGSLEYISSYNCKRTDERTGEDKDTLFLFARTDTQPYTYYYRALDDGETWQAWHEIKLSIASECVSPVYAFGKLFIFWAELKTDKSTVVTSEEVKIENEMKTVTKTNTQSVDKAAVKYSFLRHGEWVPPQMLEEEVLINVFPGSYQPFYPSPFVVPNSEHFNDYLKLNAYVQNRLKNNNQFWKRPYILSIRKGMIGTGKISISKDSTAVSGVNTQFAREIKAGDLIRCMGEERTVADVNNENSIAVNKPWSCSANDSAYKIIPSDNSERFAPFQGDGIVSIKNQGSNELNGEYTNFLSQISCGDKIICAGQSRIVTNVADNNHLYVDEVWDKNIKVDSELYAIMPNKSGNEQLIVLYGDNAETAEYALYKEYVYLPEPADIKNTNSDTFIEQCNRFGKKLYNSLELMLQAVNINKQGIVTAGMSIFMDENLVKNNTGFLAEDYGIYGTAGSPKPFGYILDRHQGSIRVCNVQNILKDNYWSNNIPRTDDRYWNTGATDAINLLYYVSEEKSALINVANQPGWCILKDAYETFIVKPGIKGKDDLQEVGLNKLSDILFIYSIPLDNKNGTPKYSKKGTSIISDAYAVTPPALADIRFKFTRLTTGVIPALSQRLFAGGIDKLLSLESQRLPEPSFSRFYPSSGEAAPPIIAPDTDSMDFGGAYGNYFWEIFFHAPFLIAARLNEEKRYEDTKLWLQYIFNPTQAPDNNEESPPGNRFWRFLPFKTMEIQGLREMLSDNEQIKRYNFEPFDPDVIAAHRQVAYAKAVVMRYIDNLLDWGDFLFAQDTGESINQATNIYMMASDLLGKRPSSKGRLPLPEPRSFKEVKAKYQNGIPQFLIELENSSSVCWQASGALYRNVPVNYINSYFCVPENAEFIKYWDRVEDRLFKIRHCMNIEGVVRLLPLFQPPIDPRALIRAIASGGLGMSLSAQLAPPLPCFRWEYMLEKAKALTNQLSALGSALLSALEKKDAEVLNLLRNQQEKNILKLTTGIKQKELEDVQAAGKSLEQSLEGADYRKQHYASLLKEGISTGEHISIVAMTEAMAYNILGNGTRAAAAIAYATPQAGSPFAMTYGGLQIGNSLTAASGAMEIGAIIHNYISQLALTISGYERRNEEWTLQQRLAEYDVSNIKHQLASNEIRRQIAEQALKIHEAGIKQNEETELYYKGKFTNKELYQWLANRLSTVYFQTYAIAYDMALAAQKAYQYEYNTDRSFINFGYWDDRYKGLGAAEGLLLALNQMEKAAMEKGSRCLEIEKNISLMQINPKALLDLKTNGECLFELSEKLFDYDFPGHYARKIKTVYVSIPAVFGPYQNIKATLTQLGNYTVVNCDSGAVNAVNFLLGGKNAKTPSQEVMRSNWSINQQIIISKGVNDSGMFELSSQDGRYLPFEGTGAVSSWKLCIPKATNRISFESISDVIITLKYTALDGGDTFRANVSALEALKPYSGAEYYSMNQIFSSDWFKFMHDHSSDKVQVLTFTLQNFVLPNISSAKLTGFYFKLDAEKKAPGKYISFMVTNIDSVTIDLSVNNDFSYNFKADKKEPPEVKNVVGSMREISFDLSQTPESLKLENKYLNPDILHNIQLILYYEGKAAEKGESPLSNPRIGIFYELNKS